MLPLAYRGAWIGLGGLLVAAVLVVSLSPGLPSVAGGDKLHHAAAYAVLMLWFAGIVARPRDILIGIGLLTLGVLIEFLQGLPAIGRSREAADVVANATGIAVGLGLARLGLSGWCLQVEGWLGLDDGRRH